LAQADWVTSTCGDLVFADRSWTCTVHFTDNQETLTDFRTSATDGLDPSAIPALVAQYGNNELEVPPDEPLWLKFAKQVYENPLILLLMGSSVVSALMGNYDDAMCVVIAVLIVLTGEYFLMVLR
jgi:magnesium-transporting ATPase (P-type)